MFNMASRRRSCLQTPCTIQGAKKQSSDAEATFEKALERRRSRKDDEDEPLPVYFPGDETWGKIQQPKLTWELRFWTSIRL
ncbi:unnamed protein product [Sphagnum tenellum]